MFQLMAVHCEIVRVPTNGCCEVVVCVPINGCCMILCVSTNGCCE